jgi:hypothetical protein
VGAVMACNAIFSSQALSCWLSKICHAESAKKMANDAGGRHNYSGSSN